GEEEEHKHFAAGKCRPPARSDSGQNCHSAKGPESVPIRGGDFFRLLPGGLLEVLLRFLDARLDRRRALRPPRGANLAVLLEVLQRIEHAERLIDAAAERQVVDGTRADDPLLIDDEGAAERDAA